MKIRSKHNELLILLVLFWATTITVLRALRYPNDWAEAHWLINYNFGFIKRGLVGTLFSPFASENSELAIIIASTTLFLIFCIVLLWVCMRIVRNDKIDVESFVVVLIFLTSPYMVMSAHLNGYFDNILVLISIFACTLIIQNKIVLCSLVVSIGVLVHETIFIVGFPSILFFALLQHIKQEKTPDRIYLFLSFLSRFKLVIFLPVFVFFCILLNQTLFLELGAVKEQLIAHLSQFDFVQQKRNLIVPDAFTHSYYEYLVNQSPNFLHRIMSPTYVLHNGMSLSILLYFSYLKFKVIGHRWLFFVLLVIVLLPLSLNLIAWDTSRIWTYPLVVAMIGVWGITENLPKIHVKEEGSILFLIVATVFIIFQLFILTPLMDYSHERFSINQRILLYAPSLILFAALISKNYCLTKRST